MPLNGTCAGKRLYEFFAEEAKCKRIVDAQILLPISKRIMTKNGHSLVIVGSKVEQHILDNFYGMGMKHMTILEQDDYVADKISQHLKTSSHARRISLIHAKASQVHYGGYTFIDLDVMNSRKNQSEFIIRALKEQAEATSTKGRMKCFVFTQSIRKAGGHQAIFKYINEVVGVIGSSLKGFNGEEGGVRKGTPVVDHLGMRVYCLENIPDFSFVGPRLKEFKCFSYRDKKHSGMITTMLIYR